MIWRGRETLRPDLVEIDALDLPDESAEIDRESIERGLDHFGQVRPVLVEFDGTTVSARAHIVEAARSLGWTHVAVRPASAEEITVSANQMTLIDEVIGEDRDADAIGDLAEKRPEIEDINRESAAPDTEWIGLPEFIPAKEPMKVVISCDNEEERDALFDVLGISTIHKGTRGTISVWWPDREKKDLASIRFVGSRDE